MTSPNPTRGTWSLIHAERAALAADLAELTAEQWDTPSLCEGLTVREVLAHLSAGAALNPVRWLAGVVRCRFDFDRQVAMRLAERMGDTPAETLEDFRRVLTSTTRPGVPVTAMLGETIVHGEDIRRPLGIRRDHPVAALSALAAYYQGSDLPVLSRSRVHGLRLTASDGPFAAGDGPEVSGTTLALVMAMAGRADHHHELDGDGVAVLHERHGLGPAQLRALARSR
ncbi:maleylpyruvate isomerase family mycothiol-dependent enzyme [Streptacidiphilus rugosus]|uniref:maleylpyruvate isomerase family mycothiol-dependent enzyme n=1 Tax=Streptacidiphilus rugosus TaxID=405783 RepID=UPI00055E91D9|nr:maleylpyruvate isomerase family mycothiol-dependent enzyme [Streptacidiphilus rugosus]